MSVRGGVGGPGGWLAYLKQTAMKHDVRFSRVLVGSAGRRRARANERAVAGRRGASAGDDWLGRQTRRIEIGRGSGACCRGAAGESRRGATRGEARRRNAGGCARRARRRGRNAGRAAAADWPDKRAREFQQPLEGRGFWPGAVSAPLAAKWGAEYSRNAQYRRLCRAS